MKIKALKTFLLLANNNCDFSVYKVLGLPRATMWAHITEIENETGLKLINRRKQNNSLTEEGRGFISCAQKIIRIYEEGISTIKNQPDKKAVYEGNIIISTTKAVSSTWLMTSIKEFYEKYPRLKVNIVADDHLDKQLENTADIFVRPIGFIEDIERKWYISYHHGLFASKEYISKYGMPTSPSDLLNHSVMGYGEHEFSYFENINWHLKGKGYNLPKLNPTLTINSTTALFKAACESIGICSAPVESNKIFKESLIRVLPEIEGPIVNTYFCVKKNVNRAKERNMQVFNDFLRTYLSKLGVEIHDSIN